MSRATDGRRGLMPIYSAEELMATKLPDPKWALPGLVPEGVTLLVGAPKLGKSFLVLNLAIAVATGGSALGLAPVVQGAVLYAALEDSDRRLQSRLTQILGDAPGPTRLFFTHVLGRGDQMIVQLDGWLASHDDARLVIIDVLGRVAKVNQNNEHSYQAAYDTITPLQRLAEAHGVAIVLVHHTRKAKDQDAFKEVSGSGGWVGAADTVIVLRRGRNTEKVEMHITGRDVVESVWNLVFDAERGTWTVSGEPPWIATMAASRRRIFEHLWSHGAATPKNIAEALGDMKLNTVQHTVRRMADDGQLQTDGTGRYWVLDTSAVSAASAEGPGPWPTPPASGSAPASSTSAAGAGVLSAVSATQGQADEEGGPVPADIEGTDTTDRTDRTAHSTSAHASGMASTPPESVEYAWRAQALELSEELKAVCRRLYGDDIFPGPSEEQR